MLTTASGTSRTSRDVRLESTMWVKADIDRVAVTDSRFFEYAPLIAKNDRFAPHTPRHLQHQKQFFG
jgi:hypothetical protein